MAGRKKLVLDRARDQAVLDLETRDRSGATELRDRRGPRDAPGGEVGEARIEDLAGADEVVEGARELLERRHAVRDVGPVEVDSIRLQTLQARLDGRDHRLTAVAGDEDAGALVDLAGVL